MKILTIMKLIQKYFFTTINTLMKKGHPLFRTTIHINKHGPGIITHQRVKRIIFLVNKLKVHLIARLDILKNLIQIKNGLEKLLFHKIEIFI